MSQVRIKICGITRAADAVEAASAGADAVGLVFAAGSPRRVSMAQARAIVSALPPFAAAVGVFVNESVEGVRRTAGEVGLSCVQLHGEEPAEFVGRLAPLRVIKALRVRAASFVNEVQRFRDAGVVAILLDAFDEQARGGSGKRFDWDLVAGAQRGGGLEGAPPMILAGGLTPENVVAAIRRIRPYGVDVSSGVEDAPGVKSAERIGRFIAAVRSV